MVPLTGFLIGSALVNLGFSIFGNRQRKKEAKKAQAAEWRGRVAQARVTLDEGQELLRYQRAAQGAAGFDVSEGTPVAVRKQSRDRLEKDILATLGLSRKEQLGRKRGMDQDILDFLGIPARQPGLWGSRKRDIQESEKHELRKYESIGELLF